MAVTAAATKTVSFNAPYSGRTFQLAYEQLIGRDGYLAGGETSDDGSLVTTQIVTLVQRGIIATTKAATAAIPVPTATEPWFLVASIPDDDPASGVLITATADLNSALNAVVIAFKANGRWRNPRPVHAAAAAEHPGEVGIEQDVEIDEVLDGSNNVTAISVYKGEVLDPDGVRRKLGFGPTTNNSAKVASLTPLRPHSTWHREDFALLRQTEEIGGSVVLAMGTARGDLDSVFTNLDTVTAPAKRGGYFGRRGGSVGQQWWAWGDTTSLFIQGGPAGEAFAATSLLTGAGNINTTFIPGQRAADSAVILLYVDNLNLRIVSFNPTTGAQINAPVNLVADGGAVSHVKAVLDRNETLHITYEHDEATQQIYYMTCSIASLTFGAVGVSSRIVAGAATGTNDTWPSIGIDRKGVVTIAYIKGTGTNEHGDLIVATIEQGTTTASNLIEAADEVGIDLFVPATDLDTTSVHVSEHSGVGAVATAFLNLRRTAVVVTPHDEVLVFTLGLSTGTDVDYLLLHRPGFLEAHGFELINVLQRLTTGRSFTGLAAYAGELGETILGLKSTEAGNTTRLYAVLLGPDPMVSGRLGGKSLQMNIEIESVVETSGFTDLLIGSGAGGSVVMNYVETLTTKTVEFPVGRLSFAPHPRDICLGSWVVPPGAGAAPDGDSPQFEIFNTRPKRMNYPFLVGDGGDFQGFGSIYEAARQARRSNSDIVVRTGIYQLVAGNVQFMGGVRGDGRVVFRGTSSLIFGTGFDDAVTVAGNVVAATVINWSRLRAGSVIDLDTSGKHTVIRNLGYHPGSGTYRVVVADNATGAPVGTNAVAYFAGLALENVTIAGEDTGTVVFTNGYQPRLRDLRFDGQTILSMANCLDAVLENLDFSLIDAGGFDAVTLTGGDGCLASRLKFADGQSHIRIENDEQNPKLLYCSSDGADPTETVYNIAGSRTTPVLLLSCTGRVTGDAFTQLNPVTVIDARTDGTPGNPLMKMFGHNLQTTSLLQIQGRWGAELGTQSAIDAIGDFCHSGNGDWHLEDFYQFSNGGLWALTRDGTRGRFQTVNTDFCEDEGGGALAALDNHVVSLSTIVSNEPPSWARLISLYPITSWTNKPVMRFRVRFVDAGTDEGIMRRLGGSIAYFSYDPQGRESTPSNEVKIFLVNDSAVETEVLTGFEPDDNYYWYWIAYKSATEAWWGISDSMDGGFLAAGSIAVGAGVVETDPFTIRFETDRDGLGGPVATSNAEFLVDAVGWRTGIRQAT